MSERAERKREWDKEILRRLVRMKDPAHVSDSFVDQFQLHQYRRDLKAMAQERKPCERLDREVEMLMRHVLKGRPEPVRQRARAFVASWWDVYRPRKCER